MAREVLVLFSGGKDSLLAASRIVESDGKAVLVTMNNGALACERNVLYGAGMLADAYGPDAVSYAGACATAYAVQRLGEPWARMSAGEFGRRYPSLMPAQVQCLHCQTAMWTAATAFAKSRNIREAAAGYKSTDPFCTGCRPWLDRIERFLGTNGIKLSLPVWDFPGQDGEKRGRNLEMLASQAVPCVLEPKCLIGRPASPMSDDEVRDMSRYFDDCLADLLRPLADRMERTFRHVCLTPDSLRHGPVPGP